MVSNSDSHGRLPSSVILQRFTSYSLCLLGVGDKLQCVSYCLDGTANVFGYL